jgi:3-deoxy-D-arabino-heptulosonate 7-phosphate (DAHP) synthase
MTEKAKIAANAVSTLLGLSEKDQSSLLEVLDDYFTAPEEETGPESDVEDLDYDGDEDRTIIQGIDIIRDILSDLTIELKARISP